MTTDRVDLDTALATLREQFSSEPAQRAAEPPRASALHRLKAWLSR